MKFLFVFTSKTDEYKFGMNSLNNFNFCPKCVHFNISLSNRGLNIKYLVLSLRDASKKLEERAENFQNSLSGVLFEIKPREINM
jgi:hypothetical protein